MSENGQNIKIVDICGQKIALDDENYFIDDTQWTEQICKELAEQQGLTAMTEKHWSVLHAYRNFYARNGRAPLNRDLKTTTKMTIMEMERLFPGGLKHGARRLCGLPNPKTCQ